MPASIETSTTSAEFSDVIASLNRFPRSRDEQFTVNDSGECNRVLIGQNSIVKIPRIEPLDPVLGQMSKSLTAIDHEFYAVCAVNELGTNPPLAVPEVEDAEMSRRPYYLQLSRVPGDVLSHKTVRQFTVKEQEILGKRIGNFVAWIGQAVRLAEYDEFFGVSGRSEEIPDRLKFLRRGALRAALGMDPMPFELERIVLDCRDEFREREKDGSLEPTIVGHDDLRPGNLTFDKQAGRRALHGVFDFGITKPSSPERELRHLALYPAALETGIDAYEAVTYTKLSPELIQFWAIAQVATTYAGTLRAGNVSGAKSKRQDLQLLLPHEKWEY